MTRRPLLSLRNNLLSRICGALFLFTLIWPAQPWAQTNSGEVVYAMDFASPAPGKATSWLEKKGFEFLMDAEALNPHFNGQSLVLETPGQTAGLFSKELRLSHARRIRISWGVDRYPRGADWDQGIYRVPIAVMISFGDREITSGSWFVPAAPYFIGLFLSQNAREGHAYTANYYQKGGRYFCQPCDAPAGETVTTEFDLAHAFKSQFDKAQVPPITGFGFQMNTEDTQGGARAFLKKVEFLSD